MIVKTLVVLVVAVAVLAAFVASRPSRFRVERSAVLDAPAAVVFAQVNELRRWEPWSPWAKLDPKAKSSFEGPAAGVGAAMSWDGDSNVGAGKMTIVESRPNEVVRFRLEFTRPLAGVNDAEFAFKAEGARTRVTWSMAGVNGFVAKAVGLFIDCDKLVGGQFEKGLASLDEVSRAASKK